MNLTVDASVFVADARGEEIHYSTSLQLLLETRHLTRPSSALLWCSQSVL